MTGEKIRNDMIGAREEYIKLIKNELLGPGSEFNVPDMEHELISSSPLSRYSIGILFTQGNIVSQGEDETEPLEEPVSDGLQENLVEASVGRKDKFQNCKEARATDDAFEESLDDELVMSTQYKPSSMGITFIAKGNTECLCGKIKFATYRHAKVTDCVIPYEPQNCEKYVVPPEVSSLMEYDNNHKVMRLRVSCKGNDVRRIFEKDTIPESEYFDLKRIAYKFVSYCSSGYVREPYEIPEFIINFGDKNYSYNDYENDEIGTHVKLVALRRKIHDDIWSITIMLVNEIVECPENPIHCIFQPQIIISTENNNFNFVDYNNTPDISVKDLEEQSLELLYRHKKIYGTGLGTAVDWAIEEKGKGSIWNDFFPEIEVPAMSFSLAKNEKLQDYELSMKYLSDLDPSDKNTKIASLKALVDLYKEWVDGLQKIAAELDPRYKTAANRNLQECCKAYKRMYAGIATIENNDTAFAAFLLANRAMFMQRVHIGIQGKMASINSDRYPGDEDIAEIISGIDYYREDDTNCRWRPFQIAFLLMDINSIIDDNSPERDLVDLIWFPTGGGKTEAYLGLTAFTIFYRRLICADQSAGTTVIMRYTLRLLAAQQFTRAATLICACEYIRRDGLLKKQKRKRNSRASKYPSYPLGDTPITIGLWIGNEHIPNKVAKASEHLNKLMAVSNANYVCITKEQHNKFQILKCPWCGTKMVKDSKKGKLVGAWGYAVEKQHFFMFCPHEACDFTDKLPIQIIDEELYKDPPTLLFGTVDKFAMMPWDSRISAFFGVNRENRAPELIIQDELHLISGALGTIVGLYETAIDAMCKIKKCSPKIIASTATIRRAKEQCSVLYNRDVVQFPAPGLEAEDSFFAREAHVDFNNGIYGRKYIGIMPSGKSKAMMEIRAISALLQKLFTMQLEDDVKDKLWTLTVYFNSLKDLGKASSLVDDDVKDFILRSAIRLFTSHRLIVGKEELTSRVSTTELNETLDKLEKVEYSKNNFDAQKYASNVLLATNMISVGIDVARLNVMLMVGQPKLTSEYIQASSRVGRSYPGVVFVQYDSTKSRDRSHYERFKAYHESFYRFVEPTGATPFSKPARERALHAVLITLMRIFPGMEEESDAINFDKVLMKDKIDLIKSIIINRINEINNRTVEQAQEDIDEIEREIMDFFDFWQDLVVKSTKDSGAISFGRSFIVKPPTDGKRRLMKPFSDNGKDVAIRTLTSMRNVDSSVTGSVIVWGNNDG